MRIRHVSALVATALLGAAVLTTGPAQAIPGPAKVTFTVANFSPNADGKHDAAYLHVKLSASATGVTWHVASSPARVAVTDPVVLGNLAAGDHEIVWKGKTSSGATAKDGGYSLYVTADFGSGMHTYQSGRFFVDTTGPTLSVTGPSSTSLYPYVDGYRDSVTERVTTHEAGVRLLLTVTNSAGHLVRNWGFGTAAGAHSATWKGVTAADFKVQPGRYVFRWTGTDALGNVTVSRSQIVNLSNKKIAARSKTITVSTESSFANVAVTKCAKLLTPAPGRGWSHSAGLQAKFCPGDSHTAAADYPEVALFAHLRAPKSAISWSADVEVYGVGNNSVGDLWLTPDLQRSGPPTGKTSTVARGQGWHGSLRISEPSSATAVDWVLFAGRGSDYDVKSFRVTFHYHALV